MRGRWSAYDEARASLSMDDDDGYRYVESMDEGDMEGNMRDKYPDFDFE